MSKPSRIVFVRHAQSEGNVNRAVHATTPDWRISLTEEGLKQAAKAGDALIDRLGQSEPLGVYVSPYLRTMQTWREMKARLDGKPIAFVKEDVRLREQEWGNLRVHDPRAWEEIEAERDAYGTLFYRFAHGESGCDVLDRCSGFLDTIHRDFVKDDMPAHILIVTHGYTLRVLLTRWLHWDIESFHQLGNPRNCESFELELNPDTQRYRLIGTFPTAVSRAAEKAERLVRFRATQGVS